MYRIIYKNGEITEISDKQAEMLLKNWSNGAEKFMHKGKLRCFNSINDISPVVEEEYKQLPVPKKEKWSKNKRLNGLKSLKEGFLRGVSDKNKLTDFQTAFILGIDRAITECDKSNQKEFEPITSVKEIYQQPSKIASEVQQTEEQPF